VATETSGLSGTRFILTSLLVTFAVLFGFGVGMLLMGIGENGGMQSANATSGEVEPRCVSVSGPSGFEVLAAQISPDASRLALFTQEAISDDRDVEDYVPGDRFFLHLRKMDSFETDLVENSQRIVCGEFSPDGWSFIFVTLPVEANLPAKLMRLELDTDMPPVPIGTIPVGFIGRMEQIESGRGNRGFVWFDDGTLGFITDFPNQIVRLDAKNGDEVSRVDLDFRTNEIQPNEVIAPLGDGMILATASHYDGRGFIQDVVWLDTTDGSGGVIVQGSPYAEVLHDSMILFTKGATLYQAGYDPVTRSISDEVSPVFTGLRTLNSWSSGKFDVANDGTVVHLPGGLQGGRRALWVHPEDESPEALKLPERAFEDRISVARDGNKMLVTHTNGTNAMWDVWAGTVDPPRLRRIVSFPDKDIFAGILSHDGELAAAQVNTTHPTQRSDLVVFSPMAGAKPVVLETDVTNNIFPYDIHPANDRLVFGLRKNMEETEALYERSLDPDAKPRLLLGGSGFHSNASWNPDGDMLAFTSNESGVVEAFVSKYAPGGLVGRLVPVSNGPAEKVFWTRDATKESYRLHYFANGVEHIRSVRLQEGVIMLGAITVSGRRLDDDVIDGSVDLEGRIYMIRKGENESVADRVEVIFGRFSDDS
jgi:hypothetical protein